MGKTPRSCGDITTARTPQRRPGVAKNQLKRGRGSSRFRFFGPESSLQLRP
jgi:hypothetical protein